MVTRAAPSAQQPAFDCDPRPLYEERSDESLKKQLGVPFARKKARWVTGPKGPWQCRHCDESFDGMEKAREHFGTGCV
jgi:hypothetical protein